MIGLKRVKRIRHPAAAVLRHDAAGVLLTGLLVLLFCLPADLRAQTETTDDDEVSADVEEPAVTPAADEESETPSTPDDPSLLLKGEALQRYLQWLRSEQNADNVRQLPDYSITSIALEGTVKEEQRAELKATIAIQVNRDDKAIRVPLNLNEATLTAQSHEGPGTASPGDEFLRENGHFWWLRGKGRHTLTLSMVLPISKKQLPTRRLQLTIPATAVSRLKLRVPLQQLSAKVSSAGAWVKTTSVDEGKTDLEVQWFGRRLDLTWEPLSQQGPVETVLQARTIVNVKLSGELVELVATQKIQAITGTFKTVNVHLPAGYRLADVEGKFYSDHQINTGNLATVTLTEQTKGPIELKWTLDAAAPGNGEILRVQGFEVDRARRQSGQIAISGLDGFRITRRESTDRYVRKISVSDLEESGEAISAYRFVKQPFLLELDLREIKPGFSVQPDIRVKMTPERAQLDARFTFSVYRGAVPEILVHWPQLMEQGWNIETIGPPELLNRDQTNDRPPDGLLRIPLLRRKSGEFELHLTASRPIPVGEEISFSLPYVEASTRQPTMLNLFSADNVEIQLSRKSAALTPLPGGETEAADELPENLQSLNRARYRIEAPADPLAAKVVVHERQIATRATASVELLRNRLEVTQSVNYNVAYERLGQVLLLVPRELKGNVRFTLGDDVELTPNSTLLDEGAFEEVRLTLPRPLMGKFDIVARYVLDLADIPEPGASIAVSLPLVQSSDSPLASTRLECRHRNSIDIVPVDDELWDAQSSLLDSSAWLAAGAPTSVALELSETVSKLAQEFHVRRAAIQTIVESNGVARSRAQFRLDGVVSAVALKLAPGRIALDNAWWGARQLTSEEIAVVDQSTGTYRLEVAEVPQRGESLLTVEFHSTNDKPLEWTQTQRLFAPEFASGVWIEELLWQVTLPGSQLLFTQPSDFTPQFRWQRRGLLWSRQPIPAYARLNEWIAAGDGPADDLWTAAGNTYSFTRFGPAAVLQYRTTSLPFVVFLGAGLSLAAGFLLLYLPLTRNVLTFLLVAFCMSAVALWFPAPVELLLQPAVLGLLLAVVAALINSGLRRERRVPVLTLSSPSDFNARLSSVESAPVRGAGSEDPTAVRPAPTSGREMAAAPESGSHI